MPRRIVLFALAAVATIVLAAFAAKALLVIFGGVLFALAARGVACAVSERTRLPYRASVGLLLGLIVISGVLLVVLAGPRLVDQLIELAKRLPGAAHDAFERVGVNLSVPGETKAAVADAKTVATGAFVALESLLGIISAAVVVFFIGVYGAVRPNDYKRVLLAALPERHRAKAETLASEVETKLTRWMLGRLVAMTFVGTTCAITFGALGVPLAMSLAVVAGLLTFVEYIGAILSAIPPILMALTKGTGTALAVTILFTALHVIEGYVLSPLIARRAVRIPPAVTLAGQVILASLVGPFGLTFATPLIILCATSVKVWREHGWNERPPHPQPA
jgi:predicted PurR-regulated permease PerM